MYSLVDVLTIGIIIVLLVFLFVLFLLENSFRRPGIYLRAALVLVILLAISEELIYSKQYFLVQWVYPFYVSGFFVVYPLLYLYSRDMAYNGKDRHRFQLTLILAFPFIMLLIISFIYYSLDYNSKIIFANLHLAESYGELKVYRIFQYIVFPAYYIQTVVYVALFLRLLSVIKKNTRGNPWVLLQGRHILIWVISIITYELLLAANAVFFSDFNLIRTVDQILSLLFVLVGMHIGLKQSLVMLQSKITRYTSNAAADSEPAKLPLLESEKLEIKEAIDNYFSDTKIYLDPNLKLESLSKKIHIPARKVSLVINEINGSNFKQFLNEFRISEAKRLIEINPRSAKIETIYTEVGFNSRSAFNHAFKESAGTSPSDYIKSLIE